MRSSPKFLAVSRSEGYPERDADRQTDGSNDFATARVTRRDDVEINELDIRLRVSYKTLLLVFVLFDIFKRVADELINNI